MINLMKAKRKENDVLGLVYHLRQSIVRSYCSILNPLLYLQSNIGTKTLVEEYFSETIKSLDFIANFQENYFPLEKKLEFFSESKHVYGRTALLLSGNIYSYNI